MPATTIKLDATLYKKVGALKSSSQSATAYVRSLVDREYNNRQQKLAAEAYQAFLNEHPEEHADLTAWAEAPLSKRLDSSALKS